MKDMEWPELRSIDVLLVEAGGLSEGCREGLSDLAMAEAFGQALSIMLELRVPRMPDTEEEWAGILTDATEGPTASSEDVFKALEAHSRMFADTLKRYRETVNHHEWMRAVSMLLSNGEDRLISWNGHHVVLEDDGTRCTATVNAPDGSQTVHTMSATSEEGAALAMLLDIHRVDRGVWRR